MENFIVAVVAAAGIPSAILGLFIWGLQRKFVKREQEKEQKEKDKERLMLFLLENSNASMSLSMATAKAVQRIPDAHCNGDMHGALEHADQVRHKHRDFLIEKGIHSIM